MEPNLVLYVVDGFHVVQLRAALECWSKPCQNAFPMFSNYHDLFVQFWYCSTLTLVKSPTYQTACMRRYQIPKAGQTYANFCLTLYNCLKTLNVFREVSRVVSKGLSPGISLGVSKGVSKRLYQGMSRDLLKSRGSVLSNNILSGLQKAIQSNRGNPYG